MQREELLQRARDALGNAHAPYSRYPVAAAVLDDRGRVHIGVNVENASYGLTMCAERVAIFSAVAAGARRIEAVAVTAERGRPVAPCGACRQVMAEFCRPAVEIASDDQVGRPKVWTVAELLPEAFDRASLGVLID